MTAVLPTVAEIMENHLLFSNRTKTKHVRPYYSFSIIWSLVNPQYCLSNSLRSAVLSMGYMSATYQCFTWRITKCPPPLQLQPMTHQKKVTYIRVQGLELILDNNSVSVIWMYCYHSCKHVSPKPLSLEGTCRLILLTVFKCITALRRTVVPGQSAILLHVISS